MISATSTTPLCNPWGWSKLGANSGIGIAGARPVRRTVAVLGSTGSIGTAALEIVRRFPDYFSVNSLSCGGSNEQLIAQQITEFHPKLVVISNPETAARIAQRFPNVRVVVGIDGTVQAAKEAELVVAAISGVAGLRSTIAALESGAIVALANKESIVCGADILRNITTGTLIPVDSEHSSLAQLLLAVPSRDVVSSLTLTASGGPFLERELSTFESITPEQAVKHPRWNMGAKISIDSSTLVNKALEWFEAVYLFGIPRVDIVIHPQSIVHACITLRDGATLANLSQPDMKLPIAYAMGVGERLPGVLPALDLVRLWQLTFKAVDEERFPAITLARQALTLGAFGTCLYSLANEVAVERFCAGHLRYTGIVSFIAAALSKCAVRPIDTVEAVEQLLEEVRLLA